MTDSLRLFPSLPLMLRALKLATQAHIAVYDCLCVALAEQEERKVVTADARLLNSLQATYPVVISRAPFP